MAAKLITFLSVVAAASAVALVPVEKVYHEEAPAHYEFQYSVQDSHSGDIKQQHESRQGDAVQGSYSLLQPDGLTRVVHYSADHDHGFNAQVTYEGHPAPAPAKIAYAAPVAKLAYSAPVAYAAPVAKLAYSAPVAKVAYSAPVAYAAPVAKLAYSAPVANYAYSAPVAKIAHPAPVAYAAPVAKLAYSAPVAKVAYSAPLAHVTYSSPVVSYHH